MRHEPYMARAIFEAVSEAEKNNSQAAKCNEETGHDTVNMVAISLVGANRAENLKYKNGASREMLCQISRAFESLSHCRLSSRHLSGRIISRCGGTRGGFQKGLLLVIMSLIRLQIF